MPEKGIIPYPQDEILSFEEINQIVDIAVECGIDKIKITGGEPLVRKGIVNLVRLLSRNRGIKDLSMTTNGVRLGEYASALKLAGLKRVNVSLDTLDEYKFRSITRGGRLKDVFRGLEEALASGFSVIKINTVIMKGINEDEIYSFVRFAKEGHFIIRFIEFMPGNRSAGYNRFISTHEIRKIIERDYFLEPVLDIEGFGPATYYRCHLRRGESLSGVIGFISSQSNPPCGECRRLRISSDGRLRSCLYDHRGIGLKDILRNGQNREEIARRIRLAIYYKPEFFGLHFATHSLSMCQIGG